MGREFSVARICIVEDQLKDLRVAEETARAAGFSDIEARPDIHSAIHYLETAGEQALPDLILLDLELGVESGYEILRIRYATPQLRKIPVVVWTHLGEENCEVCALFNVSGFVSKWEGVTALREVLAQLLSDFNHE